MLDFAAWFCEAVCSLRGEASRTLSVAGQALSVLKRLGIVIAIALAFLLGLTTTVILSLHSSVVIVPDVVGKDRFDAENALRVAGLNFRVRASRPSNQVKPDTVLFQLPGAGEEVKEGQTVAVDVSRATKEGEASETITNEGKGENRNASESSSTSNDEESKPKRNKNTNKDSNSNGNTNNNANSGTRNGNADRNPANANSRNANANTNRNANADNTNARNSNDNANSNPANRNASRDTPEQPATSPTPKRDVP